MYKRQAQNGAIEPLVLLLSGASPQVQIAAAAALRNLAENNNDNQEFIARANDGEGVNALVEMAHGGNAEAQEEAIGALQNLATNSAINPKLLDGLPGVNSSSYWSEVLEEHSKFGDTLGV